MLYASSKLTSFSWPFANAFLLADKFLDYYRITVRLRKQIMFAKATFQ
jgi:hypothetical protein